MKCISGAPKGLTAGDPSSDLTMDATKAPRPPMAASPAAICMVSLPRTISATHSSPCYGTGRRAQLSMKPRSRQCSTASPSISPGIWILIAFWGSPVGAELEKRNQRDQDRLNDAGDDIEREAAMDIGGARLSSAAGVHPVVLDDRAPIAPRACHGQAERACHGGFRPAGIGRAMQRRIPSHGAERSAGACTRQRKCRYDQDKARQARRHKIQEIVQPRRSPAEGEMARRAM